ncbi:MAG: DUF3108 domain-containing protein [Thiotrichales bacterium]
MIQKISLVFFTLLLLPTAVLADLPEPFTAVYEVRKGSLLLGKVIIKLDYDGDRYIYTKHSETRGILAIFRNEKISETSIGIVDADTLRAISYDYIQKRGDKASERHITIDNAGKALEQWRENKVNYQIVPGTLDRSSVEIALMRDANLNTKRALYPVAEKGKLRNYEFVNQGLKKLEVPAGTFECIEYKVERETNKRSTALCLAPALDNIPVMAVHTEKGTSFEMVLLNYIRR